MDEGRSWKENKEERRKREQKEGNGGIKDRGGMGKSRQKRPLPGDLTIVQHQENKGGRMYGGRHGRR